MSEPADLTTAQLSDLIDEIDKLAWSCDAKRDWTRMADRYAALDPSKMSLIEIIANARTVFSYREKITTWADFRDRAVVELTKRGRDPKRLLQGLF